MSDQATHFANIGDLPKHVALPILARGFDKEAEGDWIYCETHAGRYEYPRYDKEWNKEQQLSIGVLERKNQLVTYYGEELGVEIGDKENGRYPGSIKVIEKQGFKNRVEIHGWDTDEEVVATYPGKELVKRPITVDPTDGFKGVSKLTPPGGQKKLVFCDPFWKEDIPRIKEDVLSLLRKQDHVILWYTGDLGKFLEKNTEEFRDSFRIEWYFMNHNSKWGQTLKGAGLFVKGINKTFVEQAYNEIKKLEKLFKDETWIYCEICNPKRKCKSPGGRKNHIRQMHREDFDEWEKNEKGPTAIYLDLMVQGNLKRIGPDGPWRPG